MSQESNKNKMDFQESQFYRKQQSENEDDKNLQNFYFEDENQHDFNSVKTDDIKMQQELQQFMSEQIKQTTDYQKQTEQRSISSMYPAEQIKKILLNNFPEIHNEVKVMTDSQLLEIYEELVNCKQLKNRPEASFSSMISTIINCFPNMRDTIVNYDEEQIRKLYYNALKHQPLRVKQNYHPTFRISSNQNVQKVGNTTRNPSDKSIFQMKSQILQKAPNFKHQINKLTDHQIQLVYNSSKRQTSFNQGQSNNKAVQKRKYATQNKQMFDKKSQNLSLVNNKSSVGLNLQSTSIINSNKKVAANSVNKFSDHILNQIIKPTVQPFGIQASPAKGLQSIRYYELNCYEKDLSQSFAFVYQKSQQKCLKQQSKKTEQTFQFSNSTCNCCQNNTVMKVLKQMAQLMTINKF